MKKSEQTRLSILQKSFDLIYTKGYQATSVDDILSSMQVTKGAFFYHFKNKDEMALALIKELMYPGMKEKLITPLENSIDPIKDISELMTDLLNDKVHFDVRYGCIMVNLIEEMAPLHSIFNNDLKQIVVQWVNAIKNCLEIGQKKGLINRHVDAADAASYIVAGYAGARNMGKIFGEHFYGTFLKQFKIYMSNLA